MSSADKIGRIALVDIIRGVAIIGVIFYHVMWDLRYFQFVTVPIETTLPWIIFQRVLVGVFVTLVGVSLVLAHGNGPRWNAFWRRFGILAAAALLTSAGTWIFWPEAFVYFGILHAIALFSLAGLLFLRLNIRLLALIGLGFIVPAIFFQNAAFDARWLSWLGFWQVPPLTNDLVPVFPWFGFTLLGMAGMRTIIAAGWNERISRWGTQGRIAHGLQFLGRWTLLIYLAHQLVLVGIFTLLASWLQPQLANRPAQFLESCQQNCLIGAGEGGFCARYCQCSLEQVTEGDLWEALNAPTPTPQQSHDVTSVVNLCSEMAREALTSN